MLFRRVISSIPGRWQGNRGISALYLSGDKAKEQFAVLTPFMDIERVMHNPDNLIDNIIRRDLATTVDIERLYRRYQLYVHTIEGKKELEQQREEIHRKINDVNTTAEEKQQFTMMAKNVRDAAKSLRDHAYGIESNFILKYLALPNDIHPRVPEKEAHLLFSNISAPLEQSKTRKHLELDQGRTIELVDNTNCFYKGDVARFDYLFPHYCCTEFFGGQERGFQQFSNPDFVRTILVEGGRLEDVHRLFHVQEDHYGSANHLQLAGCGSMLSYLGFLTKLQVFPSVLPLRLICTGKQYRRVEDPSPSLFNVTQTTSVQALGMAKDEEEALRIFDELTADLQTLYRQFRELQFRMVVVPASQLASSESLKVSLQMFSNSRGDFVEVGNVVYYGDYISKRLLFSYKEQKENRFPHLVSATVVDVANLIGCHLENNSGEPFKLPDFLS